MTFDTAGVFLRYRTPGLFFRPSVRRRQDRPSLSNT